MGQSRLLAGLCRSVLNVSVPLAFFILFFLFGIHGQIGGSFYCARTPAHTPTPTPTPTHTSTRLPALPHLLFDRPFPKATVSHWGARRSSNHRNPLLQTSLPLPLTRTRSLLFHPALFSPAASSSTAHHSIALALFLRYSCTSFSHPTARTPRSGAQSTLSCVAATTPRRIRSRIALSAVRTTYSSSQPVYSTLPYLLLSALTLPYDHVHLGRSPIND